MRYEPPLRQPVGVQSLTGRQRQVLRLTALGCTIDETARILNISHGTVDNHRARIMKQLGIRRNVLLARFAIEQGISPLDDALTAQELASLEKPS
jgi:DNA-binding CsgD family transcriptional regulator